MLWAAFSLGVMQAGLGDRCWRVAAGSGGEDMAPVVGDFCAAGEYEVVLSAAWGGWRVGARFSRGGAGVATRCDLLRRMWPWSVWTM